MAIGNTQHDCSGHVTTLGTSKWVESKLLPGTTEITSIDVYVTNTVAPYGGTYNTLALATPNTFIGGFGTQTFPSVPYVAEEETDECEDGHYVDQKTIRTVIEDGEDQITGRCLLCNTLVYLPEIEGSLAFERAGKAVGRAMTLEEGDGENVAALLADVGRIERDLKAQMMKFKRALGMLDIARDLIEERICA